MRLENYVLENMGVIFDRWQAITQDVWSDVSSCIPDLRDHAQDMVLAVINDMQITRFAVPRHDIAIDNGIPSAVIERSDLSSVMLEESRMNLDVAGEYRALRASVLHVRNQMDSNIAVMQMEDRTRFYECVDQLLAESLLSYMAYVEHSRDLLLRHLGHDIRQPLCAVSMMAGLLEDSEDLNDLSRHMASQIVVASREIMSHLSELLNIAGSHLRAQMQITPEYQSEHRRVSQQKTAGELAVA